MVKNHVVHNFDPQQLLTSINTDCCTLLELFVRCHLRIGLKITVNEAKCLGRKVG